MATAAPGAEDSPLPEAGRSPSIEVALATFNSEAFLAPLLDSLFAQTVQGFLILVSDDASDDATAAILVAYAEQHPGRIRLLPAEGRRRGVVANFDRLLAHATADYVFLCDHDDVWLPHKIERSLQTMRAVEARHGPDTPLLIHTDLIVTGADLQVLGNSFFEYTGGGPPRHGLLQLLLANVVTGCTVVINRALCRAARPIPVQAMMHDHWLALVALATGAIEYVPEATILCRQHGGNVIGARPAPASWLLDRIYGTLISRDRERIMKRYSRQAMVLLARFAEAFSPRDRAAVETLVGVWDMPRFKRYTYLRRCGLGLSGVLRNLALFVVVTRAEARRGASKIFEETSRPLSGSGEENPSRLNH